MMSQKSKNKKLNNMIIFRWLSDVAGKHKWQILVLLILQTILGLEGVVYVMLLRDMIDAAVAKNAERFVVGAVALVVLVFLQMICRALDRYLEENSRSALENRFKKRLLSVLMHKDYASVAAVHSGEWMNRLTSDTTIVSSSLVQILPGAVGMLIKMCAALIMLLMLEPRFGWIMIPGGLVLVVLTYGFRKHMKRLHKEVQESDGRLRMFLQEHLGSLVIVRSFAMEEQIEAEAEGKMDAHKAARMKRNFFSNFCNVGFGAIMQTVYLFGAVFCAYGIMTGTVTYGTLTAVLQLIGQVQSPMANITGYLPRYYGMMASAERLMEAEELADDCPDEVIGIQAIREYYEKDFKAIGLEDISFTYLPPIQDPDVELSMLEKAHMPVVLQHVSLEIEKGDYVAFTGLSGCGKSTMMKLLMCLYPIDEGRRYLLNGNKEKAELTSSWHKLFAYVPQGNQLLSGSIREIVAFSDKSGMQQEERMHRALKIACADEFINTLEQGLDTVLGERGQGLSEGQMQRIAIARAVFSDNPILILDEATSALDDVTEQRLLENLKSMTDKTVLIVTHRPAALGICNKRVIVSEQGVMNK